MSICCYPNFGFSKVKILQKKKCNLLINIFNSICCLTVAKCIDEKIEIILFLLRPNWKKQKQMQVSLMNKRKLAQRIRTLQSGAEKLSQLRKVNSLFSCKRCSQVKFFKIKSRIQKCLM